MPACRNLLQRTGGQVGDVGSYALVGRSKELQAAANEAGLPEHGWFSKNPEGVLHPVGVLVPNAWD